MPSRISSSETRTTSSTSREQTSSPIAPATGVRRASAIVGPGTAGTGCPASSAVRIPAESSGSTPMTRASGRRPFTAVAIPAIRPPPPIGTITVSTSGASSTISSPTVPWPAAIRRSSYGWTITRPVSAAMARIRSSASMLSADSRSTVAP